MPVLKRLFVPLALALALTSCGELATVALMQFSLEVQPAAIQVKPGASASVHVAVRRIVPVNVSPVPVHLRLTGAPAGVSAPEVDVPIGSDGADLSVSVAAGTAPGGPYSLKVEGQGGLFSKTADLQLTVSAP